MRIELSPQRRDDLLAVSKAGDILTINGEDFDFSSVPDGATIEAGVVPCEWIVGPIDRIAGELHLTLLLPHVPQPEVWQGFPVPLEPVPDGPVDLPSNTLVVVAEQPAVGGHDVVTTTKRWHQSDRVERVFVPDPPAAAEAQAEEAADGVDTQP